jgi:hypothetical protein
MKLNRIKAVLEEKELPESISVKMARGKALKLVKIGHYLSFLFYLCTFNDS